MATDTHIVQAVSQPFPSDNSAVSEVQALYSVACLFAPSSCARKYGPFFMHSGQ